MMFSKINFLITIIIIKAVYGAYGVLDNKDDTYIIVNASEPVTLNCNYRKSVMINDNYDSNNDLEDKYNLTNVNWYKDNNLIISLKNNHSTISKQQSNTEQKYSLIEYNLFITSVKNSKYSGIYYCKGENKYGEFFYGDNITLAITYLKTDFRESPVNNEAFVGSNVNFSCEPPKSLPEATIWWEKNDMQIDIDNEHYKIVNKALIINNVTIRDVGKYVCAAKNTAGIRRSNPAQLNIYEKPQFKIKPPSTIKQQINKNLKVRCDAIGFPKPVIEWRKDFGELINRGDELLIENVDMGDEGSYVCVAKNNFGNIETKVNITVYEKPTFIKQLLNVTIGFESKSLVIECNAKGYPKPIISWSAHSQQNNVSANDFLIMDNGNLFIEQLSKKYEATYLCQARNEYGSVDMRTILQVKTIKTKALAPIIQYNPQNQTIALSSQALLECKAMPSDTKLNYTWYKNDNKISAKEYRWGKYNLEETGTLLINSLQKSDSGIYKCLISNFVGETFSSNAELKVEDPNDPNIVFKRNYETSALPFPTTQPNILSITSDTVLLTWQPITYSGHSQLVSYRIEYFSPEFSNNLHGWTVIADNIPANKNVYTVSNLLQDTYYVFIVRARNELGYGAPSPISEMIKTQYAKSRICEKMSNEYLEKELSSDIVQLFEPGDVLSSTSINITWKLTKPSSLIDGFNIKYKPLGSKSYKTETISDNKRRSYVLNNLEKYTTYEIIIEPFCGLVHGHESNVLQAKTKEDTPDQSPLNLSVELESLTSISINWKPPSFEKTNGIILGYKIFCIANDTKYNKYLDTNSTIRGIILSNLLEGMRYCVKVAAYTKLGTGPFTQPFKCVEMVESNLILKEQTNPDKIRNLISKPWFIVMLVISTLITIALLFYCLWLVYKTSRNKSKFNSDNVLTVHKTDNGNRYKLVNETIWMDTLHSSNHSNHECCCVPDLQHQLFKKQPNPSNVLQDHNASLEQRLRNSLHKKYTQNECLISHASTCHSSKTNEAININSIQQYLKQQTSSVNIQDNNNYNSSPHYAELYATNHYASIGLFSNANNLDSNSTSDVLNQNTDNIYKSNSKTISPLILKYENNNNQITEKELREKYIQATQSRTNTPRVPIKNIQNNQRVNSLENQIKFVNDNESPQVEHIYNKSRNQVISYEVDDDLGNIQPQINESNARNMIGVGQPPPKPRHPPPSLNHINHINRNSTMTHLQNAHYNSPWNINLTPSNCTYNGVNTFINLQNTIQQPNNDLNFQQPKIQNQTNIILQQALYSETLNRLKLSSPMKNLASRTHTLTNSETMNVNDDSSSVLLNQMYHQYGQTNRIYKLIQLTNDTLHTDISVPVFSNFGQTNDLSNLNEQSNLKQVSNNQQIMSKTNNTNNETVEETNTFEEVNNIVLESWMTDVNNQKFNTNFDNSQPKCITSNMSNSSNSSNISSKCDTNRDTESNDENEFIAYVQKHNKKNGTSDDLTLENIKMDDNKLSISKFVNTN